MTPALDRRPRSAGWQRRSSPGIQALKPILEMDDPDWHDQIDVHLNGTANVLRVSAPLLCAGAASFAVTAADSADITA